MSIHALVAPDDAVPRRRFLEDVASAGDFAVCRDRDAARLSMVLYALANGDGLPEDYAERTGVLYEDVLGRLPELCDHVDRSRDVWGEEDATLAASDAAFADGRAVVDERPDLDLAVVTVAEDTPEAGGHRFGHERVDGLHPMAVNNRTERVTLASSPCSPTTSAPRRPPGTPIPPSPDRECGRPVSRPGARHRLGGASTAHPLFRRTFR